MLNIFLKELKSFFQSSIAYIFLFVFLLINGIFFVLSNLIPSNGYYPNIVFSMIFVFLFLVPMLTMKMLSSERHEKTDQLLLTSPIRIWEIVVGKFLASFSLFLIAVVITFICPIILRSFGVIPVGETIGAYIGFTLIGMCFVSLGIFVSSITESQVTAAVGTFGVLFLIWIMDWISSGVPNSISSGVIFTGILVLFIAWFIYNNTKNLILAIITFIIGVVPSASVYLINKNLYEGFILKFFDWFSLIKRYEPFNMGMLSLSSIFYYISFAVFFIFLTIMNVDKRRWS